MNKNIIIGVIVVALLAGIFIFIGTSDTNSVSSDTENTTSDRQYDKVPPFSLQDYDGNSVSNTDFEGKALVVNSWATWCPFCVDELPDFGKLQEEFPDDIVVIAIDRSESLSTAKEYTDNFGLTEKILFLLDSGDTFYQSIGGFSMPETLFVDKDGNVRVHKRGPMRIEEMREKVNLII